SRDAGASGLAGLASPWVGDASSSVGACATASARSPASGTSESEVHPESCAAVAAPEPVCEAPSPAAPWASPRAGQPTTASATAIIRVELLNRDIVPLPSCPRRRRGRAAPPHLRGPSRG